MKYKSSEEGVPIDRNQLEKIVVNARIPRYVWKYAKDHLIGIGDLIMAGFDAYRENDVNHAFERLSYHENCVLHWKQIVLQHESACSTKHDICSTIKETFISQGRGQPETRKQDLYWIGTRVVDMQNKGITVTVNELYNYCCSKEKTKI